MSVVERPPASEKDRHGLRKIFRPHLQQRIRLVSGLILFSYVLMHYLAHATGLISLDALFAAGNFNSAVWRFPPMSWLLYGALALHMIFGIVRLVNRASLRMPASEAAQLVLGVSLPFLLALHVIGTRWANAIYGLHDNYSYVILSTFVQSPFDAVLNCTALVAAWIHAMIGLHMWLRFKPWYGARIQIAGLALAIVIPILALGGFLSAGRFIVPLSTDGEWLGAYYERLNLQSDDVFLWLGADANRVRITFAAILIAAIIARIAVGYVRRRRSRVTIDYLDGPTVSTTAGVSLLDISKLQNVPHASVCGGRGRCSTCRVKVIESNPPPAPAGESERHLLDRIGAPDDVRLACQLRPRGNMRIMRLLPADTTLSQSIRTDRGSTGEERVVTVLFADLRNFTQTSETRLPFDVVYLINQFSIVVGEAIEQNGGYVDKFLGDGVMALFGTGTDERTGALGALNAARAMSGSLRTLNERLKSDLREPLRMGIGIHTGPVILGDMGYGRARGLTAIGDTVNTASRLENATKSLECVLCVSEDLIYAAEIAIDPELHRHISIRGKAEKFGIYAITNVNDLEGGSVVAETGKKDEIIGGENA